MTRLDCGEKIARRLDWRRSFGERRRPLLPGADRRVELAARGAVARRAPRVRRGRACRARIRRRRNRLRADGHDAGSPSAAARQRCSQVLIVGVGLSKRRSRALAARSRGNRRAGRPIALVFVQCSRRQTSRRGETARSARARPAGRTSGRRRAGKPSGMSSNEAAGRGELRRARGCGDGRHPGDRRSLGGVEIAGLVPDAHVGLLQNLAAQISPGQDTRDDAVEFRVACGDRAPRTRRRRARPCAATGRPDRLPSQPIPVLGAPARWSCGRILTRPAPRRATGRGAVSEAGARRRPLARAAEEAAGKAISPASGPCR